MDKLMKTNWFVMLISFVLALMLYTIVAVPKNIQQNANSSTGTENSQERIEGVEVQVYYDDTNYVVSGMPKTVDVTLTGSPTKLLLAKIEKGLEVYLDLNDLSVGTHTVQFQYRGISEDIGVTIQPAETTITIEKRVSKNFPVEIELMNKDTLPEGYSVDEPIVSPTTVTVYGSERQLSQIKEIKGIVDIDGGKETFVTSIPIKVYDRQNRELTGFSLHPNVVDVEVPIVSPHKFVPIKINRINQLPEGLTIESMTPKPETVVIYGEKDAVEKVDFVEAVLDLKKLANKNTVTVKIEVQLPKGIKRIEPKQIEVTIKLGKEVSKTIKKVPLQVNGLREGLSLSFVEPEEGTIDVVIKGAKSILENITLKDIQAIVDASDLGKGEHKVAIKFNGPQNVTWQDKKTTVKID